MGWCEQQGISGRNRRKLGWYMSHKRCTSWLSPCESAQALSFLCVGAKSGSGFLCLRLSICLTSKSMAVLAITSICWPMVVIGIMASLAIGELSKRLSHSCPAGSRILYDKVQNMLAYVSFARNTPFFLSGYFSSILLKITFI